MSRIINGIAVRDDLCNAVKLSRSRFTRDEVKEIILEMKLGESLQLKNDTERTLFYSVAYDLRLLEDMDVRVSTTLEEVKDPVCADNFHCTIRLWRSA
jgi:hypothetical protein|tara:strand:- start:230 stop:523 length:294 start_codon:yes stop_codon:yes gene_type:complete